MSADVILGAQWGDEGKGKIVDLFSEQYDVIVRYQGGANAGHTVIVGREKYVMHLLPSGVLHKDKMNIISHGVVLDMESLVNEIIGLQKRGIAISPKNLLISENISIVLPYHKMIDKAKEARKKGGKKIGTTGRGIGPAYTDKYVRIGVRLRDIFNESVLIEKVAENLEEKNFLLKSFYKEKEVLAAEVIAEAKKYAKILRPYMANTVSVVNKLIKKGKKVLFEGAQGALLDIDYGTYPYVTSSNPTIGGVMTGGGVSFREIKKVWGITKAYQTRVGNGPFPTELDEELGSEIREAGGEYGATTGRPRRCGWLDLVALKYVCDLNGLSDILLTKIDVLSKQKELKVCTHYLYKGKKTMDFVSDGEELYTCKPVYKKMKGWDTDITGVRKYKDLPAAAKTYIKFIEKYTGVKVSMVSVGPERDQILKS